MVPEGCPESHLLTPRGLYDLNKEESVIQPIPKSTESVSKSETADDADDSSSSMGFSSDEYDDDSNEYDDDSNESNVPLGVVTKCFFLA